MFKQFFTFHLLALAINSQIPNLCYITPHCGTDCLSMFKSCVEACTTDCEIIFEADETNFFFRNSSSFGIEITNKTNFHITGLLNEAVTKAKVIIHGLNSLFTFKNCKNITISNLIFDFYRSPFTAGIIDNINYVTSSFDLIYNNMNSYPFPGSLILNDGENYDWLYNVKSILGFDSLLNKFIKPDIDTGNNAVIETVDHENQVLKIKVKQQNVLNNLNTNQEVILRHTMDEYNMISIEDSSDILITEIEILSGTKAFNIIKNTNITFDNIKIIKNMEKPMSLTGSGINLELNKGDITIIDSIFSGLGSDTFSIHNYFFEINGYINKSSIGLNQETLDNIIEPWLNIGDIFEFRDRHTLKGYYKSKLIEFDASTNIATFLDEFPLNKISEYDIITSLTSEPNTIDIINNQFIESKSIGTNIKASNVNLLDNNFKKISGPAILISCEAGNKLQSGVSKNVVISNNNITDCNYLENDIMNGTITITATIPEFDIRGIPTGNDLPLTNGQVHNSVRISNNIIDETTDNDEKNRAGMSIRAVRGFIVQHNTLKLPRVNFAAIQEFNDLLPTIVRSNQCRIPNGASEKCIVVKG